MKFVLFKSFLIILLLLTFVKAEENSYLKKGKYYDWSLYAKKNKKICYVITKPIKSEGKYKLRGKVNLLVGRRTTKTNKNFVGVGFGYPFKNGTKVDVVIDKKHYFKLSTFDETAWVKEYPKKNLNNLIIKEMIRGNKLIAKGVSKRGTKTKDIYSLRGFSKAFKKLLQLCG